MDDLSKRRLHVETDEMRGVEPALLRRSPAPDLSLGMVHIPTATQRPVATVMVPADLLPFPLNAETRALIQDEIDVERAMGDSIGARFAAGLEVVLDRLDRLAALVAKP